MSRKPLATIIILAIVRMVQAKEVHTVWKQSYRAQKQEIADQQNQKAEQQASKKREKERRKKARQRLNRNNAAKMDEASTMTTKTDTTPPGTLLEVPANIDVTTRSPFPASASYTMDQLRMIEQSQIRKAARIAEQQRDINLQVKVLDRQQCTVEEFATSENRLQACLYNLSGGVAPPAFTINANQENGPTSPLTEAPSVAAFTNQNANSTRPVPIANENSFADDGNTYETPIIAMGNTGFHTPSRKPPTTPRAIRSAPRSRAMTTPKSNRPSVATTTRRMTRSTSKSLKRDDASVMSLALGSIDRVPPEEAEEETLKIGDPVIVVKDKKYLHRKGIFQGWTGGYRPRVLLEHQEEGETPKKVEKVVALAQSASLSSMDD